MFKTLLTLLMAVIIPAPAFAADPPETHKDPTEMRDAYKDSTIEAAARAAHEANRAYCESLGDHTQAPWDAAPDWQRDSARIGARGVLEEGNNAKTSHESWMRQKVLDGWTFGLIKNAEAKTHPCLVPFEQLSASQRAKDDIFVAVTKALGNALEPRPTKRERSPRGSRVNSPTTALGSSSG